MGSSDIIEIDLFKPKSGFYVGIGLSFKGGFVFMSFIFIGITWNYKTKKYNNNKWVSFNII